MTPPTWLPPSLSQPRDGYHFTLDSWLVAAFAAEFRPRRWCDLGTGCGPIALALAKRFPSSRGVAVERQPTLARHARTNLAGRAVTLVEGDLRFFPWRAGIFDLLVCNPPYFAAGSGHVSRVKDRAQARHVLFGDLDEFARALCWTLAPGGRLCFVYPADRLAECLAKLAAAGWFTASRLVICSYWDREPVLVCSAMVPQPQNALSERCLTLYENDRNWTAQAHSFLSRLDEREALANGLGFHNIPC